MSVFDAVSGGHAALVLDTDTRVFALVVFQELATGARGSRLALERSSTRSRAVKRWSCSRGVVAH